MTLSTILVTIAGLFAGLGVYIWRLRQTRNELQEIHQQFHQLTDNIKEIFWIGSIDWKQIYFVSPAYEFIWGLSCESLYEDPLSWIKQIHPEDEEKVRLTLENYQPQKGISINFPIYRIIRPDGTMRWLQATAYPVKDFRGITHRIAGIVEDITEKHNSDEQIRNSNRTLEALTQTSRALIRAENESSLLKDICKILVTTGKYELVWVGLAENDPDRSVKIAYAEGEDISYLENLKISWSDGPSGQGPTGKAIRTGKTQINQNSITNEGYNNWRESALKHQLYSSIALPIKFQENIIGALNIYSQKANVFSPKETELLEDLTDDLSYGITSLRTKNALGNTEKELSATLEHLENISETIPDILYEIDTNGNLVTWNNKLESFTELDSRSLVGKMISELIAPEDVGKFNDALNNTLKLGNSTVQLGIKSNSGIITPFLFRSRLVKDKNQIPSCITGIARDLTSEIEHKNERERFQQQLQQAQKMETIGQLTGGIAHDFNNILSIIIGFVGLIQDTDKNISEESRSYLEEVDRASNRAKEIVSQLLAFSRTDSSQMELISLQALVSEVSKMLRATLPSSINIEVNQQPDTYPIIANPTQIHQCLTNLCINARDAIEEQQGKIIIDLRNTSYETPQICSSCHEEFIGEFVSLTVNDTGEGISKEHLTRIFDPFFTTKPLGKGTGMGLAMIHGIIHKLGGHILVDSDSKGTCFRLLVPIPSSLFNTQQQPESNDHYFEDLNSEKSVLLVDDEESITRFLRDYLELHGYKVDCFNSSKSALKFYRRNRDSFDIVITDHAMPELTGIELSKEILNINPRQKIILCTGFANETNEEDAYRLGIRGFINKPINNQTLLQLMSKTNSSDNTLEPA